MGKSNVNADHYNTGGRERQGDDITQDRQRQKYAQEQARMRTEKREGKGAARANPGAKPDSQSRVKPKKTIASK